jgi:ribosome-associated toxin RatA of RatAB toxin-antitoxin module
MKESVLLDDGMDAITSVGANAADENFRISNLVKRRSSNISELIITGKFNTYLDGLDYSYKKFI